MISIYFFTHHHPVLAQTAHFTHLKSQRIFYCDSTFCDCLEVLQVRLHCFLVNKQFVLMSSFGQEAENILANNYVRQIGFWSFRNWRDKHVAFVFDKLRACLYELFLVVDMLDNFWAAHQVKLWRVFLYQLFNTNISVLYFFLYIRLGFEVF